MYQFFVDELLQKGMLIRLSSQQEHHAKDVLRLQNETVRLVYEGMSYFGVAKYVDESFVIQVTEQDTSEKELPVSVTLAMACIRREKFELVLQKATELGVSRIVPFTSERSVVLPRADKKEKQKARWQSIVEEASAQCKRNCIPIVEDVCTLEQLKDYTSDLNLVAYENEKDTTSLAHKLTKQDITVVIGPEGGFGDNEIAVLENAGFVRVSLGNRILRAETAALFMLSVISDRMNDE